MNGEPSELVKVASPPAPKVVSYEPFAFSLSSANRPFTLPATTGPLAASLLEPLVTGLPVP
jgi:hypothetical protein